MQSTHIIQSQEWGKFKSAYGTKSLRVGNIQYTLHKIPFTSHYYAYCGRVTPTDIEWDNLHESLLSNGCVTINFDVPNVIVGSEDEAKAEKLFNSKCEKSPKNTFAKFNYILDIDRSEDAILASMHPKARYNIKYAQKHGVTVKRADTHDDFEAFCSLQKETAIRQKYYIHPQVYYQKIWDTLGPLKMAYIVTTYFGDKPLSSWMLFKYKDVLYYPYGGSSTEYQNLFPNELTCWEAIKLGKELGCKTFDMWGAAANPFDKTDPWYGFTNFKSKFGGKHVEYIDSYDYVINKPLYTMFNTANDIRWKILKALK